MKPSEEDKEIQSRLEEACKAATGIVPDFKVSNHDLLWMTGTLMLLTKYGVPVNVAVRDLCIQLAGMDTRLKEPAAEEYDAECAEMTPIQALDMAVKAFMHAAPLVDILNLMGMGEDGTHD